MIQANELRIGNLTIQGVVAEIDKDSFRVLNENKESLKSTWFEIEPTPLTEEWLVKFRFYKIVGWDDFTFYRKNGIDVDSNDDGYYFANRKIEYVHQLQNLYFALTGQELTIKN